MQIKDKVNLILVNQYQVYFTKLYKSSISITNKWVRVSYATYLNTLNLTIKQRKDIAYKMGHSFATNLQYGKTILYIICM